MEDEDGESKITDMWNILGDQQLKESPFENTLKQSIDNVYADVIEEEKHIIRCNSVSNKDSVNKTSATGTKIIFKGYKKRILAQAQETQTIISRSNVHEQQSMHTNASPKNSKDRRGDTKRGKITEYAQYLGLQPSSKSKCSKCRSSMNVSSTLKQSQCTCDSAMAPVQGLPSTSESASLSNVANFKITRKVYLCAACGTYFENWNLFLHMRDIHKRHICLFCLGMFGQAERLSYHLSKKHSVPEMAFTSVEDFYGVFKGSCYLVCCTCEKVFSETDNFYNHFCSPPAKQGTPTSVCTLCRQTGVHAITCTLALESSKEPNSPQPSGLLVSVSGKPVNAGSKSASRKLIKNNRTRGGDDNVPSSYQQKFGSYARRGCTKLEAQLIENQLPTDIVNEDEDTNPEYLNSVIRDTVSETIMEVSRYVGDSCSEEHEDKYDKKVQQEEPYDKKSPLHNDNILHDTVTQTIMEVSSHADDSRTRNATTNENLTPTDASNCVMETRTEATHTLRDDLSDELERMDRFDESVSSEQETDAVAEQIEETDDTYEKQNSSGIQESESPDQSPVNRSVFSPQHEANVARSKEEHPDHDEKQNEADLPTESSAKVSFNAVASSDGSLVIKICANRNSQFSIASTANTDEYHGARESEENNNADRSALEDKMSVDSERERDGSSDYRANNEDSDSDSDKLAVVDSNTEDVDDVEDAEVEAEAEADMEVEAEAKTEVDMENQVSADDKVQVCENATANGPPGEAKSTDQGANENDENKRTEDEGVSNSEIPLTEQPNDAIPLAGADVPMVDLNVEGTLESMEVEELLKRCIDVGSPFCVYCNHARHIAVNGKQLGLHMLAEHKFQPQHPAIIINVDQFVSRVKRSLDELDPSYFNLNSYSSVSGTYNVPTDRTYECFHCRFHSSVHKELYLHNRKMHQKTILICIMCKSTFYSYSELLCHLCPGVYSPNINVKYRCCLCPVTNLPSAFRLMVHLRKRHHACDVCLESTGNQQRLSNHVWKHKLHHLCYRCGIAYRNKPDITKHLFWKHGTESVLCKKCLQKKWPHIYHFCIPPTAFVCEECGSSFSRAVALKVHKRLHSGDRPYACNECAERFVSRKLLTKHESVHGEPENVVAKIERPDPFDYNATVDEEKSREENDNSRLSDTPKIQEVTKDVKETVKKVLDVYDLPPLNLSSESDTDPEDERTPDAAKDETSEKKEEEEEPEEEKKEDKESKEEADNSIAAVSRAPVDPAEITCHVQTDDNSIADVERNEEEKKQEAQIMDGIWDNFKSYAASLEMQESTGGVLPIKETEQQRELEFLKSTILADHDYCVVYSPKESDKREDAATAATDADNAADAKRNCDEDYAFARRRSPSEGGAGANAIAENDATKRKTKSPKKKKQDGGSTSSSDSSSDSDSSSCSCGTNCSCSSSSSDSSSSSSSSSDSDSSTSDNSPRKQAGRKEHRKEKEAAPGRKSPANEPDRKNSSVTAENGVAEASACAAALGPQPTPRPSTPPPPPPPPPPPAQTSLRESDLETDETETDEDFYDEHPQQLANKLLAEKRNQLLLLAAVAPASTADSPLCPLNNGITDSNDSMTSSVPSHSADSKPADPANAAGAAIDAQPQQQQQRKKVKTKKRKKADRGKQRNQRGAATPTNTVESIKLNIPKAFYQKNPTTGRPGSSAAVPSLPSRLQPNDIHGVTATPRDSRAFFATVASPSGADASSEADAKRSSKRKRVPKRFYGDSSDEESEKQHQPALKWRKSEPSLVPLTLSLPSPAARLPFGGGKSVPATATYRANAFDESRAEDPLTGAASATESDDAADSSSGGEGVDCTDNADADADVDADVDVDAGDGDGDAGESTESEVEVDARRTVQHAQHPPRAPHHPESANLQMPERSVNLYCYCQCPYDEVSEMIACDGEDCRIEWFHFECVGIMVPPKGKWYCPDCRKKHGIVQNSEDYFD